MIWWSIKRALIALHRGEVIAYPTEAVFGLGCDPKQAQAVAKLLALKQRPPNKGLIIIGSCYNHIEPYINNPSTAIKTRLTIPNRHPITWLLPAKPWVPRYLTGDHPTIAVRITTHPIASAICQAFSGAIVSTSANRSKHPCLRHALNIRKTFGQGIAYVMPGILGNAAAPSEIRDAITNQIYRQYNP